MLYVTRHPSGDGWAVGIRVGTRTVVPFEGTDREGMNVHTSRAAAYRTAGSVMLAAARFEEDGDRVHLSDRGTVEELIDYAD